MCKSKKLLAILLAVLMTVSVFPVSVFATDSVITAVDENTEPIVIYEENFDAYTDKTEIVNGDGSGWIWEKNPQTDTPMLKTASFTLLAAVMMSSTVMAVRRGATIPLKLILNTTPTMKTGLD